MTMTGEIQGTKKEFIKIFNEMCYSRSGWQVWSDLISTMACSIANAVDRSEPRFSNREKEYAHCIERLGGVDKPYFTMEWNNNHIIQCRGSHNCGMPPEVEAFVKAFEKKMQDTINENKEKEMRRCG